MWCETNDLKKSDLLIVVVSLRGIQILCLTFISLVQQLGKIWIPTIYQFGCLEGRVRSPLMEWGLGGEEEDMISLCLMWLIWRGRIQCLFGEFIRQTKEFSFSNLHSQELTTKILPSINLPYECQIFPTRGSISLLFAESSYWRETNRLQNFTKVIFLHKSHSHRVRITFQAGMGTQEYESQINSRR